MGNVSDGYHTFDELYRYRMLYNAAFFNELAKKGDIKVCKSHRHYDGEECFGGGWCNGRTANWTDIQSL